LKKDNYEIIKFFIEINEEKRQAHIQQTKSNPLMRWKVQEYEEVISQDVYLNEMRRIIHNCNDWQVIDYTVREQAITNMYLHI
ncbi:phosphate--AMP phosphotransferase, partial [Staphylococcus warneri]